MTSKDPHGQQEIDVFREFAKASDKHIIIESILKRDPPEPDIICEIKDKGLIAFELVRLIPEEDAHRIALWASTRTAIKNYYNQLAQSERIVFDIKHSNAFIHFRFKDLEPLPKRKKELKRAFDHLLDLRSDFVGHTLKDRQKTLREISIDRNSTFERTYFDTDALGFVTEPTEYALNSKFKKTYETDHPIQLLAYFASSDILPDPIWFPLVNELLEERSSLGMFNRIWFYDETKGAIKFVYPGKTTF